MKFNETFSEKETNRFFIVMEFCRDGDLSSLISFAKKMNFKLDTMRVMKIFIQLVLGLHELHTNNILHRDVKPENVFVNEVDSVKLGDFGCFKVVSDTIKAKTYIGTPQYMAPEIHLGSEYGTASDIWSLGVVLYQLCTLTRPFDGPNNFMILKKIVEEPLAPIPAGIYPLDLVKALEGMLDKTEKNRPSTLMLLQMPLMVEFAKRFDIYKYFPSERVASPTLPASKAKSMGIVPSTIPASPMIYLFRVKCKNFMFGHEYGYGKEEKDVAGQERECHGV